MLKRFLFFLVLVLTLFACSKDENNTVNDYSKGTFIVNEGLFNSGTGTITYIKEDVQIADLFEQQNPGLVLGNIAQSIIKFDNKYFIAVNNSAKIVVVNASDFKMIGEIKINLPRYFVSAGNKLYVTSWSTDFTSGFINLIDVPTLSIKKSTPVEGLAEKMIVANNNIYTTISAREYDKYKNHVIRYDITKDELIDAITVGDNSNDLVQDKNGDIWILCSGFYNFSDPKLNTNGSLHKISGNKSVFSIKLDNGVNKLAINQAKDKIYFLGGTQVFQMDVNQLNTNPQKVYDGSFYNLGVNPNNNDIYLLNAKDFTQNGEAVLLNSSFNPLKTINTGIIPTFVYFSK